MFGGVEAFEPGGGEVEFIVVCVVLGGYGGVDGAVVCSAE